jgi:ribosome-associated heat shock protein Hsp15
MSDQPSNQLTQRIDKWLWHARFFKTRSLAQKQVTTGKIRVDREKISSPSRKIAAGNVLTITREREIKIIEIKGLAEKRGPYSEAQLLYNDLSPPKPEKQAKEQTKESMSRIKSEGRPTKHQRKQIMALKRNSSEQQ